MAVLAALSAFVAVAALVLGLSGRRVAARVTVDRRLGRAIGMEPIGTDNVGGGSALRGSRFGKNGGLARTLAGIRSAQQIGDMLERAGWRLSVVEFLAICGASGIMGFLLGSIFLPVVSILIAVVCLVLPLAFLRFAVAKRRNKFTAQLVDVLTLLANALKAGQGLMQAIDQAATQSKSPIQDELKRLLHDVRIGATPDDAFTAMSQRVRSDDLDIVITGIIVQRSTGGNLAEMLDSVAHVMRERIRIKGEIKTLTIQQQLSGYVVGGLPIALLVAFNFLNHRYITPLFTTTIGHVLLGVGGGLQLMGFAFIRKIVNIKV